MEHECFGVVREEAGPLGRGLRTLGRECPDQMSPGKEVPEEQQSRTAERRRARQAVMMAGTSTQRPQVEGV